MLRLQWLLLWLWIRSIAQYCSANFMKADRICILMPLCFELLDIFDAYMNTVFTKAFNREQDKERKQREAAAKRAAQKLN